MEMDPGAIRNFRDFLQLYNKMSEICFARCIDNMNSRKLSEDEITCVEDCSSKFVKFNNKLMQNFVKAQTEIVNKRVEEAEKQRQLEPNSTQSDQNHLENNSATLSRDNQLLDRTVQNSEHDQTEIVISK
ncbi:mitochondrial import inner membrane translocase subunit Tim10B [Anoplophora glabripennis]|uniref:mitochondrial import inner membrane translocase subunit Tim10B n=1 Tax=Anoplophora glabripennis TaxID=217634 RepID=UPI000873D330|nr:mitochondrial import inner membrane translocase subunit Tim10B [Anoplophora glabripennis]